MDQKVEEIPKNSSPYTLMAGETENGSPAEILVKMDQKPSKQNVTGKRVRLNLRKYFGVFLIVGSLEAGVATATPIFQILFYKIVLKISQKYFLFTVGYPNLKFLTSSLNSEE